MAAPAVSRVRDPQLDYANCLSLALCLGITTSSCQGSASGAIAVALELRCQPMVAGHSKPHGNRNIVERHSGCASSQRVQSAKAHREPTGIPAKAQPNTANAPSGLAWPRRGARLLTLERSFGSAVGADAELWRGGGFAAEVWPDVPVASTWSDLLRGGLARLTQQASSSDGAGGKVAIRSIGAASDAALRGLDRPWTIQTVAAQVRRPAELEQRMRVLAYEGELGRGPANAFLCVSGSHPARRLSLADRFLPDSFAVLRMAQQLRRAGDLPVSLALLAAENPLLNHPSRLERKIEAGAEAILTQPPLVWPRFEAWITEAHRRGLTQDAQVLVGMPMLASPANLAFWIGLCSAWCVPGIAAEMERFRAHAAQGADQLEKFTLDYNMEMVTKVLEMPGVAGLHIMPLGKGARQLAAQILANT